MAQCDICKKGTAEFEIQNLEEYIWCICRSCLPCFNFCMKNRNIILDKKPINNK